MKPKKSRAASVDGLNQPIRSGTFSGTSSRRTSQQSNQSDFRTGMSNAGSDRTSNGPNFGEFQMMNNSSTTSGVVSPTSGDNFRSGEEDEPSNQEVKKLPPLDSGPIFTRNRPGFQRSSSLQRFGSENSLGNRYVSFYKRRDYDVTMTSFFTQMTSFSESIRSSWRYGKI